MGSGEREKTILAFQRRVDELRLAVVALKRVLAANRQPERSLGGWRGAGREAVALSRWGNGFGGFNFRRETGHFAPHQK